MDEQVKARLIGATVLVVVAVALVPELLSGRKQDAAETTAEGTRGMRTVTIDLGGAVASSARLPPAEPAPPVTRDAPRPAPVDVPGERARRDAPDAEILRDVADRAPRPAATVASSEPIAPPPAVSPPVTARPAPTVDTRKPPATSGGWAVQVGAFGSAESARKLVGNLEKDGLSAYVAPLNRDGKTLHRVRVGPAANKADADALAARVKRRGLPASVIAPDQAR